MHSLRFSGSQGYAHRRTILVFGFWVTLEPERDPWRVVVVWHVRVESLATPLTSARQVGLIFCFQEHGKPTANDLFPVRQALPRLGLIDAYVLLAPHSQNGPGKFLINDHEPIRKLLASALKSYPINPRPGIHDGEGGKFSVQHRCSLFYVAGNARGPSRLRPKSARIGRADRGRCEG